MVKHSQKPTNCLSVFNHFVGLVLKGLLDLASCDSNVQCIIYWAKCLWDNRQYQSVLSLENQTY